MSPTIFILDGNAQILALIARELRSCNFTKIYSFSNPVQALKQINGGIIPDLLITGYELPGMNGVEFLNKVTDCFPEIETILFTSRQDAVPHDCSDTALLKDIKNFRQLFELIHSRFNRGDAAT